MRTENKIVTHCACCGQDHAVDFQPFTHPPLSDDGIEWSHWAPCPTNGEPILMTVVPTEDV